MEKDIIELNGELATKQSIALIEETLNHKDLII